MRYRWLDVHPNLASSVEFFDRDENSTGSLTSSLSENAQKINGLAGVTLGTITSSIVTVILGSIIGLCYGWKLSLIAIGTSCHRDSITLLMILQHAFHSFCAVSNALLTYEDEWADFLASAFSFTGGYVRLRVVVLKDQVNKKLHEESAQVACEAAGAIRTVASLVREDDCCAIYSKSLEGPLKTSNRTAFWSTGLFALTQSLAFWVIALVFWYGSRLVASNEYNTMQFFTVLMVWLASCQSEPKADNPCLWQSVTFSAIQSGNVFSFGKLQCLL